MSDLRNVKASTDIDNLTRQFYCLKQLAISQESTISYYAKKDFETNERKIEAIQNSLDSELEMNATLTKENEKLEQENAKLKQELNEVVAGLFSEKELAKRDLEQQAKGVEDAKEYVVNNWDWDWKNVSAEEFSHLLTLYVEQLRSQARGEG